MISHLIDRCRYAGVTRIVVNLWHLGEVVRRYLSEHYADEFELRFSEEDELLDTGGGLGAARRHFDLGEPILVHNGDILMDLPLEELFQAFQSSTPLALLVTQDVDDARCLLFQEDGVLAGWRNRESGAEKIVAGRSSALLPRRFCGVQMVSPRIFERMPPEGNKFSLIQTYLEAVTASELVREFDASSRRWADIGTVEQLHAAQEMFSAG